MTCLTHSVDTVLGSTHQIQDMGKETTPIGRKHCKATWYRVLDPGMVKKCGHCSHLFSTGVNDDYEE